jgi:hypothetical protein
MQIYINVRLHVPSLALPVEADMKYRSKQQGRETMSKVRANSNEPMTKRQIGNTMVKKRAKAANKKRADATASKKTVKKAKRG